MPPASQNPPRGRPAVRAAAFRNDTTAETCFYIGSDARRFDTVIRTNSVDLDSRGYIYAVDRDGSGLHIVELTGEARAIVGL